MSKDSPQLTKTNMYMFFLRLFQILRNLQRLDVTGSKNLIELPDLSKAVKFKELIIEGCKRLQKIPESVVYLHSLTKLNASRCNIRCSILCFVEIIKPQETYQILLCFPRETVRWGYLKDLSIDGLINLRILGLFGSIEHVSFRSTQQIPDESVMLENSTSHIKGLHSLNIKNFRYKECKWYTSFTCNSFSGLTSLTELKLVNLNIKEIPYDIDGLLTLQKLDLSGNDFTFLPATMGELPKLKYLSLRNCGKITSLPQLAQVETLILSECVNLLSLPLPTYCLLELWLDNCKDVRKLSETLSWFTKLTYLDLSMHEFAALPSCITKLSSLETLYLNNCKNLISVADLPQSVKYLYAHGCDSLETVSLSPNHSIKHLDLIHCPCLKPEEHEHLMDLFIDDGHSQEGSWRCACLPETESDGSSNLSETGGSSNLPETGGSSNSGSKTSETSTKLSRTIVFFRFFISCFDHCFTVRS